RHRSDDGAAQVGRAALGGRRSRDLGTGSEVPGAAVPARCAGVGRSGIDARAPIALVVTAAASPRGDGRREANRETVAEPAAHHLQAGIVCLIRPESAIPGGGAARSPAARSLWHGGAASAPAPAGTRDRREWRGSCKPGPCT